VSLRTEEKSNIYLSLKDIISSNAEGAFLIEAEAGEQLYAAIIDMAKYLFCSFPESGEYCGDCDNCRMLKNATHPDLYWLKVKEKASSIKIEDVRWLKERVFVKPYQSNRKLFVIEQAHRLTTEAANALLKTLEEPPAGVLIILISENTRSLLPTIVSRCKRIRITKTFSSNAAGAEDIDDFVLRFFERADFGMDMKLCEDLSRLERSRIEYFLDELSCIFRDMLMIRLGADKLKRMSSCPLAALKGQAENFSAASLEKILDEVLKSKNLINRNSNIKLTIDLLIKYVDKYKMSD